MNEYLRNHLENLAGKKTLKSTTQFFDNLVKSHGPELEYNILTVLFESIDWKEAVDSAAPRDAFKLDFLRKKLRQLKFEPNFVDYFGPCVSDCANKLVIYEKFRDILRVLKIGHPFNLIFSASFALDILDDRQELLGTQLLKEHLVEATSQDKPQPLPTDFVLTLGEFLKINDKTFKDVSEAVKAFFESYVSNIKDPKLKTLFAVGAPEMSFTDLGKDTPATDIAKLLRAAPKLAVTLREMVWNRSNYADIIRMILRESPTVTEGEVLEVLLMMCADNARLADASAKPASQTRSPAVVDFALESVQFNPDEPLNSQVFVRQGKEDPKANPLEWRVDQFVTAVAEKCGPKFSWEAVLRSVVSFNNFPAADVTHDARFYELLFALIETLKKTTNAKLTGDLLTQRWANHDFQFNFVYCLLQGRETKPGLLAELSDRTKEIQADQLNPSLAGFLQPLDTFLLNPDLMSQLFELARLTDSTTALRAYFEGALAKNFEGAFYTLVVLSPKVQSRLLRDLLKTAVTSVLNASTSYPELVEAFFKTNRPVFVQTLAEVCSTDNAPIFLSKLIDFSQNIKDFVQPLTQTDYHYFSISLSLLAIRREYLRLENWVEDRLVTCGLAWVNEFLFYVQKNFLDAIKTPSNRRQVEEAMEKSQLTKNVLAIVFESFLLTDRNPASLTKPALDKVRQFYGLVQAILPDLAQVNSSATEKCANEILENYYNGKSTIEEFLGQAQALKASTGNREQEILACIILNIIDEFRFYQNFPEKELFLTSEIYGQFIVKKLIDGRAHTVFLKAISDSLEKEGKMFQFGLKALNHFVLNMDLGIPNDFYKFLFANDKLRRQHFQLLFELRRKLAETDREKFIDPEHLKVVNKNMDAFNKLKEQAEEEEQQQNAARVAAEKSKVAEKTLTEWLSRTFEALEVQDPLPAAHKDKLIFWLNGLDDRRIDRHKTEFVELIKEIGSVSWFCKYLVYKRVPTEPVVQNAYRKLVFRTQHDDLYKTVYKYTMQMINQVIDYVSARETLMGEDKNTARFCGKWVGMVTLVCNRPVLLADLDIKKRLYESIENKTVSNVIPIVCAFIKNIDKSMLFKANVPFINSILDILREILHTSWINHTTKIFIEVVFTEFEINEKIIHRFDYIAKRKGTEGKKDLGLNVKSLAQFVKVNHTLVQELNLADRLYVELKTIVTIAIHSAIQDVLKRVLDRSVKVALETTRELVLRDFAMEGDDKKVLESAKNMIQNLSWNLALVSCRDPLKNQLEDHMGKLLKFMSDLEEQPRKTLKESLTNLHLELACQIVKAKVIENSIEELMKDDTISRDLEARRQAQAAGQPFSNNYLARLKAELPPCFTSPETLADLDRIEIYSSKYVASSLSEQQSLNPVFMGSLASESLDQPKTGDESKILEIIQLIEAEFEAQNTEEKLKHMHNLYNNLVKALDALKSPETVLPKLSEAILTKLFAAAFSFEVLRYYSDVLTLFRNNFPRLPSFVTAWVLRQEEPACFSAEIIKFFLKNYLMEAAEFDERLAAVLGPAAANALNCAVNVLKNVVVEDKIFSVYSFPKLVEKIVGLAKTEIVNMMNLENSIFVQNLVNFIENENAINALRLSLSSLEPEYNRLFMDMKDYFAVLNEPIFALVSEATQALQRPVALPELSELFARHQEHLKDERAMVTYFSYLFEVVVNQFGAPRDSSPANDLQTSVAPDYVLVDALTAYLIAGLELSAHPDPTFEKIVTSFIMVLTKKHFCEGVAKTNQRPFFRILFNIIQEIHKPTFKFRASVTTFDVNILQTIHILQPLKYPCFAFAWVQLLCNPTLMEAVLADQQKDTCHHYTILLVDLMMFVREVFVFEGRHQPEMEEFFKGVLRLLLVLIINHPDYVCDNSFVILEEIPPKFIQFRNMILSAYPRDMKSPDPFEISNQNYQNSPEYKALPVIHAKIEYQVSSQGIQAHILNFMKTKDQKEIDRIIDALYLTDYKGERQINTPLLESFVVYVPYLIHSKYQNTLNPSMFVSQKDLSYSIFFRLLKNPDVELHEKVVNAMLNNVRYPNPITFYFKNFLIMIFSEQTDDSLQEQITRNLFERLIIEKPHSWGILSFFYKVLANVNFKFDQKKFFLENEKFIESMINLAFRYARINDDRKAKGGREDN